MIIGSKLLLNKSTHKHVCYLIFVKMSVIEPIICSNGGINTISCMICDEVIKKGEGTTELTVNNWTTFKINAEKWAKIATLLNDEKHTYTDVYSKITNSEIPFGIVHKTCRIIFGTKFKRDKDKYGLIPEDSELNVGKSSANDNVNILDVLTRSKVTKRPSKRYCFICDEVRYVDNEPYNVGGLGRCSTENASLRLKERQKAFLENYNPRFYDAASRLQILMGGNSHNIFSADIFYHQSCYIKFAIKKVDDTSPDEEINKNKEDDILEIFLRRIKSKIVRENSAYLLNEL